MTLKKCPWDIYLSFVADKFFENYITYKAYLKQKDLYRFV